MWGVVGKPIFLKEAYKVHGSYRSRNVPRGVNHPQYKNGAWTKGVLEENRMTRSRLAMLEQISSHLKIFSGTKTRRKKPRGFLPLDLNDPEQLTLTLFKALMAE